jgi:site-specific DNA recombinase
MKNLSVFGQFVKAPKPTTKPMTNNCVIYTRVSTKEQADNNMSLETQRKACELYTVKTGYKVLGHFGGTYESAKTDERKEFNRMLLFVKRSKEKVSYIVVYSVDRFSRSGANAIYIKEQLKEQGVYILAVSQPTDTGTPSGSLQQNIQFIFSEYDNQLRREKCMAGMKEATLRGEWCFRPPVGYDIIKRDGRRMLVVNKIGKLLRKAFLWKADENITIEEAVRRLSALGLRMYHQKLAYILKNPFYCGIISNSTIEGGLMEGTHEKLISQELFLKVNDALKENSQGYSINHENERVPLKTFLKCDHCGGNIPGYVVAKRNLWYYKCRTKGCHNNKSASELHKLFEDILSCMTFDLKYADLLKEQMIRTYNQQNKENHSATEAMNCQLRELHNKLERLEERHITEEISRELYDKYRAKFKAEIAEIQAELGKVPKEVSNIEKATEDVLDYAGNLRKMWASGGYPDKFRLQNLLFPEGIRYNKKTDQCRTSAINTYFLCIALKSQELEGRKVGIPALNLTYPNLVGLLGIEPSTHRL